MSLICKHFQSLAPFAIENGTELVYPLPVDRKLKETDPMFINSRVLNNLWREMDGFRHEVDRLFGRQVMGAQGAAPALNVWEDESGFYVEADLPDVVADKLDITVKEGNRLTLSGERKAHEPANAVWHRQERFVGPFVRELTLPAPVDADKVEARFEHGVLKLTLPKSEAARPRKIAVKAQ